VSDEPQPQVAMSADTCLAASFAAALDLAGKAHGLPRPGADKLLIVNDVSCGQIALLAVRKNEEGTISICAPSLFLLLLTYSYIYTGASRRRQTADCERRLMRTDRPISVRKEDTCKQITPAPCIYLQVALLMIDCLPPRDTSPR